MMRWIQALDVPVPKRPRPAKKQPKKKHSPMPAARTIAFKAFWMMHAEAQHGSGLTAVQYASAHRLPVRRMRRESRQFTSVNPPQDWREMLHPSNRAPGKYGAKLRDKLRTSLWISPVDQAQPVDTTDGKRRQYTDKQKLAIVAEFAERGVTASMIARRHHITPSMVFRWRDEFNLSPKKKQTATLVTATVIDRKARGRPKKSAPLILENLLPMPPGAITVELADGRRVYAPSGSDPDTVRQYIAHKESRP
jgi:transposase-like protein